MGWLCFLVLFVVFAFGLQAKWWVLFVVGVVGLNGGLNYSNTLYQLLKTKSVSFFEKEMALSFVNFYGSLGIFMTSPVGFLFEWVYS